MFSELILTRICYIDPVIVKVSSGAISFVAKVDVFSDTTQMSKLT